ncbi:MAG: formate/nitrite transporter family protein [Candidatus Omnitrophica bacterium]|nr:formate/nitrite transporter family protein [Candidatus Omnitrophota bacterium]MBU1926121.1 formate/nitrite transporter family protein [Candidatus Omnitrophota bacterium]
MEGSSLFLSPLEISRTLRDVGSKKATAHIMELFIYGILAGIYISLGAHTALSVLSGGTLDEGLARLLAGSVFSVGLMLVLIPGSELFTGNILMTIGFIYRKYSFLLVLRNWLIVYFGNFCGALLTGILVYKSGLLGNAHILSPVGQVAINITQAKLELTVTEAISRGILCNMLVCLAVIMCIASRTIIGKIFGIFFPIMAFVASGYEHSVANMYFLPVGLMAKGVFLSKFATIFKNLIPVTIGNILGGLLIVFLHPKMFTLISRQIKKLMRQGDETPPPS